MKRSRLHPSEWFNNNRFVLIFSLIISLIFWLVITITVTPETSRTITNIPVIVEPTTPSGLMRFGDYEEITASVEVTGRRYVVASLSPADIVVTARITGVQAGEKTTVQLSASKNNQFSGFDIREVTPSEIEVFYDELVTREFEVEPKVWHETGVDSTAAEGLTAEKERIADAGEQTIQVEGPASEVSRIHRVRALARVTSALTETTDIESDIVFYDEYDNVFRAEYAKPGFEKLTVTVPISKSKRLSIRPTFQNIPTKYADSPLDFSLSEDRIEVIGPPDIIDGLVDIPLYPIDFSEIYHGHLLFERQIQLPSLVKSVGNLQTVSVRLDLTGYTESTVTVATDRVTYINQPANTRATITSPISSVVIIGPEESIDKIEDSDVSAVIDLADKKSGQNEVDVVMEISGYPDCWVAGSYEAIVNIETISN
ncbi:MAG TPA: hypothetical protein DEQ02_06310 [Ruminococcaceae bacterium]|nr:hypothetical protein [Oscillospiraceae bacterium]